MVIENDFGLQTSDATWYIAVALFVFWAATLPALVRLRGGWERVLVSLVGLSWAGFGLGMTVRFFLLAYDAEIFGNPSTRFADRPPAVVDLALVNAGVYWVSFVAAALAARLLPVPPLAVILAQRFEGLIRSSIMQCTVIASVCIVISLLPVTPASLITPFGILGSMWVVPATLLWIRSFRGVPTSLWIRVAVLVPGVLRLLLSPYREHILVIALVVLTAAIFAGRRVRLVMVLPAAVVIALLSTVAVSAYRQVLWSGVDPEQALSGASLALSGEDLEAPSLESLRRFHGFDSLLLTVDLVPEVFPFSERNLLLEGITRGLIPRLIDPAKALSDEGFRFQTTIWAFDDDPTREEGTAAIAPSMPGSLYEAGGTLHVALGAMFWAVLLAFVDRLKMRLSPALAAAVHVLCAVQALAGIERDFVLAFSTLLQMLVVFFGVAVLAGWASGRVDWRDVHDRAWVPR